MVKQNGMKILKNYLDNVEERMNPQLSYSLIIKLNWNHL